MTNEASPAQVPALSEELGLVPERSDGWHDEDCIFGKEVALRLKAERKTITQRAALRRIAELASATPGQSKAGLGRLLAMIETVAAVELQAP